MKGVTVRSGIKRSQLWLATATLSLVLSGAVFVSSSSAATFSNPATITIPADNGTETAAGSPFPSTIGVSGITGQVVVARVTLNSVDRSFAVDVDALLRGPGGQTVVLMSDSCSGTALSFTTLTFDDAAAGSLPASGACAPGTYKPTDNAPTEPSPPWPAATPAGPYGTSLQALAATPNGNWNLYVRNGGGMHDVGTIAGWTLELIPAVSPPLQPTPTVCHGMPATIVGTSGPETLQGTNQADVIVGFGGDDQIIGRKGNDVICGGSGHDSLFGGRGKDKLYGEGDSDNLKGGREDDNLDGGDPEPLGEVHPDHQGQTVTIHPGNHALTKKKKKRLNHLIAISLTYSVTVDGDSCNGDAGGDTLTRCEFVPHGELQNATVTLSP
jgi:Ca2+-binding RTX toxin-like protein